jgi:hypothetical protein
VHVPGKLLRLCEPQRRVRIHLLLEVLHAEPESLSTDPPNQVHRS